MGKDNQPPAALTPERDAHAVIHVRVMCSEKTMALHREKLKLAVQNYLSGQAYDPYEYEVVVAPPPARAATVAQIECPACGQVVQQVASATLDLALWQHWNWACPARRAAPPPARAEAAEGAYDPSCADCRREAGRPAAGVPDDARCVWHLRAEIARLTEDQQDWRKGVALIASALGDPADNLSCVRIAEIALQQRAALEQAEAERDQQAGALVTLREALKAVMPFVCVQPIPCSGWRCREEWCPSCCGDDEAEAGVGRAQAALALAAAALAASAPEQEKNK